MTQSYIHLITDISRCCRTYALTGLLLVAAASPAFAAKTIHVRTDGGSASQCNGSTDAAYPGSGTNVNCAYKGPMIALSPTGTVLMKGGDTMIIHPGDYTIGFGAPGAENCSSSYPYACNMASVPGGPDASNPTRIIGGDGSGVCRVKPKLLGNERAHHILGIQNATNVSVSCLEITDSSTCIVAHTGGLACERDNFPYGKYADTGILASDGGNITLTDLDVHGLASNGIQAGRLDNLTMTNVRIANNGSAGYNGDTEAVENPLTRKTGGSNMSGTMNFSKLLIEYNGCSEDLPSRKPLGCWGQFANGYGDGFGTGKTGGDWNITDSIFRYNVSDGLDLLYHTEGGTVNVNRVKARGNASNQIKIAGSAIVKNSMIQGNCGFFNGKPYTYTYTYYDKWEKKTLTGPSVDNCRAVGDALVFAAAKSTDTIQSINNTIAGEGNTIATVKGPDGTRAKFINNILVGLPVFWDNSMMTADIYLDESTKITLEESNNIKQTLRNAKCTAGPGVICGDAGLISVSNTVMNPRLKPDSKARDSGLTHAQNALVPTDDMLGNVRPATGVDRGSIEMTK